MTLRRRGVVSFQLIWIGAVLGLFWGSLWAGSAAALPFGDLIVFGDSLVDQGNTQLLATGGLPGTSPCTISAPPCDPAPSTTSTLAATTFATSRTAD